MFHCHHLIVSACSHLCLTLKCRVILYHEPILVEHHMCSPHNRGHTFSHTSHAILTQSSHRPNTPSHTLTHTSLHVLCTLTHPHTSCVPSHILTHPHTPSHILTHPYTPSHILRTLTRPHTSSHILTRPAYPQAPSHVLTHSVYPTHTMHPTHTPCTQHPFLFVSACATTGREKPLITTSVNRHVCLYLCVCVCVQ